MRMVLSRHARDEAQTGGGGGWGRFKSGKTIPATTQATDQSPRSDRRDQRHSKGRMAELVRNRLELASLLPAV